MISVRDMRAQDREAFLAMWADFVALAPGEPGNHAMGELNWQRIVDPENPLKAIVAVSEDGALLGFTLYVALPFTWSRGDACYLEDIFTVAEARGRGVARAMLAELEARGRAAGWFKIFWMTQSDNHTAQRLYDRVAERMDYIRYDLNVGEP